MIVDGVIVFVINDLKHVMLNGWILFNIIAVVAVWAYHHHVDVHIHLAHRAVMKIMMMIMIM
jgi:hypothetical protein